MHRLVLGSRSSSRRNLLERLSIPFLVVPPDIDESPLDGEAPELLVRRLSERKARAVGARVGTGLVIGSDQVALLDDTVLGKPAATRKTSLSSPWPAGDGSSSAPESQCSTPRPAASGAMSFRSR